MLVRKEGKKERSRTNRLYTFMDDFLDLEKDYGKSESTFSIIEW